MTGHKILIIKTGYSEILDKEGTSREVSKGDVLRTTPVLHLYKGDKVTWLADQKAFPLLEGNPLISRLMHYDFQTRDQLMAERFDVVINLEKFPPLCALATQIEAWKKHGFRLDRDTGEAKAYDRSSEVLTVSADLATKRRNRKKAQELLFEMVGEKWNGETYILGYQPKTRETYDVAFNTNVGTKWPVNAWPTASWDTLEKMLEADGIKVTRQDKQKPEVLSNLYSYMDWINSARLIVSNDSLGLHLGLALNKSVLGLFGPTTEKEFDFYGRGRAVLPSRDFQCAPCFMPNCANSEFCMDYIIPEKVYGETRSLLEQGKI